RRLRPVRRRHDHAACGGWRDIQGIAVLRQQSCCAVAGAGPMSTATSYHDITRKGLWQNNPALVQLLGLCPLLAVSNSVVNALGLGLATMLVLSSSNLAVSLLRNQVIPAIRLPAFVMIITAFTT